MLGTCVNSCRSQTSCNSLEGADKPSCELLNLQSRQRLLHASVGLIDIWWAGSEQLAFLAGRMGREQITPWFVLPNIADGGFALTLFTNFWTVVAMEDLLWVCIAWLQGVVAEVGAALSGIHCACTPIARDGRTSSGSQYAWHVLFCPLSCPISMKNFLLCNILQ